MSTPQHHNNYRFKQAFTLLEVLIAIFVIGVGIISVVGLMTHNIAMIDKVHTQTTATTLAREGMEMINNVRDTNIMLGYEWNCAEKKTTESTDIGESRCDSRFWTGGAEQTHQFIVDGGLLSDAKRIIIKKINNENESKLYLTGITIGYYGVITGYTHGGGQETPFSRHIVFSGINHPNSTLAPHIHTVASIVRYNRNGHTGEIVLESFLAQK